MLVVLWLSACLRAALPWAAEPRAQPIVDGHGTDHASVVAIARGGSPFCTATIITPRAVLTAAHCVEDHDADELVVIDGAEAFPAARAVIHPGFDSRRLANDLAILELAETIAQEPAVLASAPLMDDDVDVELRIVGFGWTGPGALGSTMEREGIARIAAVEPDEFRIERAPAQTCVGDSGGPAFLTREGTEELVGVASAGDIACAEFGVHTRVDTHVDDFIEPTLASFADSGCRVHATRRGSPWALLVLLVAARRRRSGTQRRSSARCRR